MESESGLFDASTNPSLDRNPAAAQKKPVSVPNTIPNDRKAQKAEHIPEEEPEHQMA